MKTSLATSFAVLALTAASGCSTASLMTGQFASLTKATQSPTAAKSPLKTADPKRLAGVCVQTAKQLAQREQFAAAIEQFEKATEFDPSLNVDHELAVLCGLVGDTKTANSYFATALESSPNNGALLSDFGFFLYSIGKPGEAEQQLRQAITLTDDPSTRANLACVLASTGRYHEAAQLLESASFGDDANYSLALLAARAGDQETARYYFDQAAAEQPRSHRVAALGERLTPASTVVLPTGGSLN